MLGQLQNWRCLFDSQKCAAFENFPMDLINNHVPEDDELDGSGTVWNRQPEDDINALLLEGLESGPPFSMTDDDWNEKKRRLTERLAKSNRQQDNSETNSLLGQNPRLC